MRWLPFSEQEKASSLQTGLCCTPVSCRSGPTAGKSGNHFRHSALLGGWTCATGAAVCIWWATTSRDATTTSAGSIEPLRLVWPSSEMGRDSGREAAVTHSYVCLCYDGHVSVHAYRMLT
ncbi:hypothetical protein HDV57DRAFT_309886 [Trichoderma longibrachiatum]|uniref:Uncharacterized protein n=1 Tax=Trichoderma longibrachiatum ATCC 18648 TaxID=983965 RepID=A0A2T4CBX3_TRILO|nr:hypothetical protein M440DRAFT_227432 [Trichoderma longibrachiatum ATCC 18648]